jgi:hypothetical protein
MRRKGGHIAILLCILLCILVSSCLSPFSQIKTTEPEPNSIIIRRVPIITIKTFLHVKINGPLSVEDLKIIENYFRSLPQKEQQQILEAYIYKNNIKLYPLRKISV